jgi:hypothetical protein
MLFAGGSGAASASGSFAVKVRTNVCTTTGGKFGYGKVVFRVTGEENGKTGTNYMRARTSVQRWSGSRWVTKATLPWDVSQDYPDNATSYYVDFDGARFTVFKAVRNYYHRLRTTVQFWDRRSGPDKLVRSITRVSKSC